MLTYVTGLSGTGKSTLVREMVGAGLQAVDIDDGLARFVNRASGLPVHRPAGGAAAAFLAEHDWVVPRPEVEVLRARPGRVWLCGAFANEGELWDLFDEVVCLIVDEATLRHRLATRTTNDFGKAPDELAAILGWHATHGERYERHGARLVDATRPLAEVMAAVVGAEPPG
jgi:hypothetical protein